MAQPSSQPSLSQQRPQFSPPPPNLQRDYQMQNGRANSFTGPSPSVHVNYSSPSPQQYSPQYSQAPPLKRQRLSPEASSQFPNSAYPQPTSSQALSPSNGITGNVAPTSSSKPGSMAPPQRPAEKSGHDQSYDDILAGTGIDLEEEARSLARPDYYSQPTSSFQSGNGSFGSYQTNSFGQQNGSSDTSFAYGSGTQTQSTPIDPEEKLKREHERADWEAARHTQHTLWDMFLFGGNINDKIKKSSHDEHLVEAQAGVLVNTQRNAPPPKVRVNGLEGASRVIDQGQSILDTREKADRLTDVMKLVSLAAKTRLTGLLNTSARLAFERRAHSKGKVPDEWADVAAVSNPALNGVLPEGSPAGSASLKRTHSQANSSTASQTALPVAVEILEQSIQNARSAEEARLARRAKRTIRSGDNKDSEASIDAAEALAAAMDPEKKVTKKEKKAAESKFSEQQQHKNANDAARMATSSIIGRTFGKKGKSYSWMTGGGSGGGGGPGLGSASTPGKSTTSSVTTPVATVSTTERGPAIPRGRRFREFDEDEEQQVQARDVLLVLESDSQAARSYVKGYNIVDGRET